MKHLLLVAALILCFPVAQAQRDRDDVIRIEVPRGERGYEDYSNRELRRRVYQLERAVQQLQERVFQLEYGKMTPTPTATPEKAMWTCRIDSMGKIFVSNAKTKSKALADLISKCSAATSSVHCDESDAKCGND